MTHASNTQSRRTPALEIQMLGRFSVVVQGKEAPLAAFAGRRSHSLLKLLALKTDHRMIRDQVMEHLWPDLSQKSASAQLYKAIHHLRKGFLSQARHLPDDPPEQWVGLDGEIAYLRPQNGLATDVEAFETAAQIAQSSGGGPDLARAASLYTGDLLPMDLYSDWAAVDRERLRELYISILLNLSRVHRGISDFSAAAESARLALDKDPTSEAAHRELMMAYAQQGRRDRALQQFETCRQKLEEELGIAPSAETDALARAIREERFQPAPSASHLRRRQPAASPVHTVGRESERQAMIRVLNLLSGPAAAGSVIVINGPMGIGKSHLAREMMGMALGRGYQAYYGRANEADGEIVYGPFLDILQSALLDSTDDADTLPAEIGAAIPDFPAQAVTVPNSDRFAAQGYLFAQMARFFRKRSQRAPLILVIEDLHLADHGSRAFVHYLSRHIGDVPIVMVVTYRTDAGGREEPLVAREIPARLDDLTLAPLSEADHLALLSEVVDGPMTSRENREVYRLSQGNPLFAIEIARSGRSLADHRLGDSVPKLLRDRIVHQVSTLHPSTARLLQLASVCGDEFPTPCLQTLGASNAESGPLSRN